AWLKVSGLDKMFGENTAQLTYRDLAKLSSSQGVTAANSIAFAHTLQDAAFLEKQAGRKKLTEKFSVFRMTEDAARGTGELTENAFRTASWVHGLEQHG